METHNPIPRTERESPNHRFRSRRKEKAEEIAVIEMTMTDSKDLLSPYSDPNNPTIDKSVEDFIQDHCKPFLPSARVQLRIKSDNMPEKEQQFCNDALHGYFRRCCDDNERDRRYNTAASVTMFLIGLASMAAYVALYYGGLSEIWCQVLYIFAWVFLSEAVTLYFLQRRSLDVKRLRYKNLANMEIIYLSTAPEPESLPANPSDAPDDEQTGTEEPASGILYSTEP